jgi:hypothetical protein
MFSRKFEGEGIQSNNDFKVSYEVVVVTSSEASSGTDSCVYLKLVGDGGDSGEFELQQSNHFNKFETGQSDSFVFRSNVALGSVQQVHVRLHPDGNLIKRSWRLDCIKVSGGDLQAPAQFPCGQVLSPENPTAVLESLDATGVPPSLHESNLAQGSHDRKVSVRTGRGGLVAQGTVHGPVIQRVLSTVSELPVCFTIDDESGILFIGKWHDLFFADCCFGLG